MKIKATIGFVLMAAIAMVIYSIVFKEKQREAKQQNEEELAALKISNTDASRFKGDIRIGLDNYLGYYPMRSKRMQREMLNQGYQLKFHDDKADYKTRSSMLANGELDFAVFTVDSYILNTAPDFTGQIVMVISESKGADAIISKKEIKTVNDLTHVTATLGSPSHQFIKASIIDFGLDELKSNIRSADGSSAALADLISGRTDAAVLWEPDISTALKDERFKTLISTRDTSRLIVDILVASDQVINESPEKLDVLLTTYFPVLRHYLKNSSELSQEFQKDASLNAESADRIIESIAWMSLEQNASQWFGIRSKHTALPEFRIVETIDLTNDILIKYGDFPRSPLPAQGAFPLLSSKALGRLQEKQSSGQPIARSDTFFSRLSPAQWASLDPVASLKIDPIAFQRGTRTFSQEAQQELANIKNILKRYPRYRLRIEGHTSTQGDADVNRQLSNERAEAIRHHLVDTYKISQNRIKAIGRGSDSPLIRGENESFRAWLSKLPRVEFHLLEEVY